MAKKESSAKVAKVVPVEVLYTLPEFGVAVMATSVDEAVKKAKALNKESKDNG